jgi:hypothetical protein
VANIASLKRQLHSDLAELRAVRAVGPTRPVIVIHGGLPGPILFARIANKIFRWTAWESEDQFIDRVVSDPTPGVAYIGGLGRLSGTSTIFPV